MNKCVERAEMSFVEVSPESHFPIQNLPYGVFSTPDNVSNHYLPQTKFGPRQCFYTVHSDHGGGVVRLWQGSAVLSSTHPHDGRGLTPPPTLNGQQACGMHPTGKLSR